jgi:hypothetical protein
MLTKHVAHKAFALALVNTVFTAGNDARRILAPVLENRQRVIDIWPHG